MRVCVPARPRAKGGTALFTARIRRARAAAALLLAAALAPGVLRAAQPDSPDANCTWHVRLAYHYREAGPNGTRDTQLQLSLEAPLRCTGSGAQLHLAPAGRERARGRARLSGNVPHTGGPPDLRDVYDAAFIWPAEQGAGAPSPAPVIELPAPSFVGDGLATRLTITGAAAGAPLGTVRDPAAAARDAAAAGDPRGLHAVIDPPATEGRLDVALTFDPLPGTPSDPMGAVAQVPQRTAEALKALGGEAILAFKGHLYGAQTRRNPDGSFSIRYQRSLALAPAALDIDFCGWLTRSGQDWVPEDLPPLDPPAAP